MALSDEQTQELLGWYINSSEHRTNWDELRKKAIEENHKWIQPDVIDGMSDEELENRFLDYFKSGGGRQTLNQIYRDRIIRDKKRFRRTMAYLLGEGVDIKERVDQILGGEYRIQGFGRAILTGFLMDHDPDKYCVWNNKTEMGFSVLGWEIRERGDSPGTRYLKVLTALDRIRNLRPDLDLALDDIDQFLHTISAEDEGREAVRAVIEGPHVEPPAPTPGPESMEFVMEKYLEEFMEANFGKIDFGAKLELYQDEENTGRQYPTPIGNIDLLALDREKKEYVVIELKKGRSSDAVVGQILRYMGWVKDNLAEDWNVRGIIIARGKDDRLEYALKLLPIVSLFTYSVSFEVKRIM